MNDYPITAIIPWLGKETDAAKDKWLVEAIRGLPKGMPYLIAQNLGKLDMADALNAALANVTTDFVWVQGADDKAGRGTIDRLYSAIGTADVAYPSMRLMRASGSTLGRHLADIFSIHRLQDENLCGVFLARTEALRDVGGWHDELIEDWDLIKRLADAGKRFVAVPDATYQYRIHKQSLSHRIQQEADKADICVTETAPGVDERKPMLATFYCGNTEGVSYLRSVLPARHLPGVARRTIDESNRHKTPAAIWEHPDNLEAVRRMAKQGRAIIVDVDDNYLSPALVQNILKAQRPGADKVGAGWGAARLPHRRIVQMADAVIASTVELAYTYARVNQNVHVIPNMVDPDDWSEIHPYRLDDTIRIGWPAGWQHRPDAKLIEPAMRWASAQPNVEVVCIGLDPGWDFAYHHEPFTPSLQTYRDILSLLDIVVAPVKHNDMTRCKSDIKWLEASMVGAAFVGSRSAAYIPVEHGETGFLARGQRDFTRYIKLLVADQDERLRVGRNATERVLETRHARLSKIPYMQVLQTCGVGSFVDTPELEAVA